MRAFDNVDVGRALRELASGFADQDNAFRAHGLARAARSIENLRRPVAELWCSGGIPALVALPWVSTNVALWLVELLHSGQIAELERLRQARFLKRIAHEP